MLVFGSKQLKPGFEMKQNTVQKQKQQTQL